ncbi:MAG: hypothetical protein VX483_04465 [Candidatus Thermoplasmatota archaeon]|nr:hypothetical protein [Candidatus Thermoplasmatota archaeon]
MVNPVLPLITLVIKSIDTDRLDGLNEDNKSLVNTLSMLCSFLSIDDFVSFIYSPKFVNLTNTEIPVKFEIGLYARHEIILDMIVENNLITLTDCRNQNYLQVSECSSKEDLFSSLSTWISLALKS